jgi:hypothetical protein
MLVLGCLGVVRWEFVVRCFHGVGCVGFSLGVIYSRKDFCFTRNCSLSYASFTISKWHTHSCFWLVGIVWSVERSMLSVRCVSWCSSNWCQFLQYHVIRLASLVLPSWAYKLAVLWSRSFLFFQSGSKISTKSAICNLTMTRGGFLLECIMWTHCLEMNPRAIMLTPISCWCFIVFAISGLY